MWLSFVNYQIHSFFILISNSQCSMVRLFSTHHYKSVAPLFFSTNAAPQHDAVYRILTYLNTPSTHHRAKILFDSLRTNVWFRNDVMELRISEINSILQKLSVDSPENAVGFFFSLRNEFGIEHSLHSKFVVARVLAEKQRPQALRCHLQDVLLRQGSGSAKSICNVLSQEELSDGITNHLLWDMVAFVYSRYDMVHDSLFILAKMKDMCIRPSIMTYNSLLHNFRHTDKIWRVYNEIKANGSHPNKFTNAIMINGLCKQSIHEAVSFLHEIEERDQPCTFTYNTLMSGFAQMGFVKYAKSFFCIMYKHGLLPDNYTCNILIHGLCVAGSVQEALNLSNDMERHGFGPDQVTYNIMAKGVWLLGMMDGAGKFSKEMLCEGSNPDHLTYTILICGHCHAGNLEEGLKLREEMMSKDIQLNAVSYHALLSSLCKFGRIKDALRLLFEIKNVGLKPDLVMYSIIIHGLCKLGEVAIALQLYKEMCMARIIPQHFPHRAILLGLCKNGTISKARRYFNALANVEDIVLYNILIDEYVKHGNIEEAMCLYEEILENGISPTIITINSLINGFCKTRKLVNAAKFCADIIRRHNLMPTVVTYTTLMNAFCEVGNFKGIDDLLQEMKEIGMKPNQVTYTVLMKALCSQGKFEESLQVLKDMRDKGLYPDQASYNTLIQCFCKARKLNKAFQLHDEMVFHNIRPDRNTYNFLINAVCIYGDIKDADMAFSSLQEQNIEVPKAAYMALVNAHCVKGDIERAKYLFLQLTGTGFDITVRDYSAVINRLWKRGLVNDAKFFIQMMLVAGVALDEIFFSVMKRSFDKAGDFSSKHEFCALMIKHGYDPVNRVLKSEIQNTFAKLPLSAARQAPSRHLNNIIGELTY